MQSKPSRTIVRATLFLFALLLAIGIGYFLLRNHGNASLKNTYNTIGNFSELPMFSSPLNRQESDIIRAYLWGLYQESEKLAGFSLARNGLDLLNANVVVKLCHILNYTSNNSIRERLSYLEQYDVESLNLYSLIYYVEICEKLGMEVDYSRINHCLVRYYDWDSRLFSFGLDIDNGMEWELHATTHVLRVVNTQLDRQIFDVDQGVLDIFENSVFDFSSYRELNYSTLPETIECMHWLGLEDRWDISRLGTALNLFRQELKEMEIRTLEDASRFSAILSILKMVDPNQEGQKLQVYYDNFAEELDNPYSIDRLCAILSHVMPSNEAVNQRIRQAVDSFTEANPLVNVDGFYMPAMPFNILLSDKSGFPMNMDKMNILIRQTYEACLAPLKEEENAVARARDVYSCYVSNQLLEEKAFSYDRNTWQKLVSDTLEELLKYDDVGGGKDMGIRLILEIIMDSERHEEPLRLSNEQKDKILKLLKDWQKDEAYMRNHITEIFLIDFVLRGDESLKKTYGDMLSGLLNAPLPPSEDDRIMTMEMAYYYLTYMRLTGDYTDLTKLKSHVEGMKIGEEGYAYYLSEYLPEGYGVDAVSTLYGHAIQSFSPEEVK